MNKNILQIFNPTMFKITIGNEKIDSHVHLGDDWGCHKGRGWGCQKGHGWRYHWGSCHLEGIFKSYPSDLFIESDKAHRYRRTRPFLDVASVFGRFMHCVAGVLWLWIIRE